MSFEAPLAFWALSLLALLAIFSLWRQSAVRVPVASLLLWARIPERNPPLRALRRPRWRVELLLQALAIGAAVTALAGPFRTSPLPKPRRFGFVFDTSARLTAGGRVEKAKEEARRLRGRLSPGDTVWLYAALPSPRRVERTEEVHPIGAHADVGPLLAAARQECDEVILFSDRAPAGVRAALFGAETGNVGIIEFSATDQEVFVQIVNHGAARKLPVRFEAGEEKGEALQDLPPGISTWSRRGDFSRCARVSVELGVDDGFPLDNRVTATRIAPLERLVRLSGRHDPLVVRALGSIPGVVLRQGGGADGLLGVGVDEVPPPSAFSVWIHSPQAPWVPDSLTLAPHPLTAGLREKELARAGVGELPQEARDGEPLVWAGSQRVAVLQGRVLHLSIDLHSSGWPSTPSFPIFWKNVVDFAGRGGASFVIAKTGHPLAIPGGEFLEYSLGEFVVKTPEGDRRVVTNLLDERESDTAGTSRPLDWNPSDPAGREPARRDLSAVAAAAALGFVVLGWLLQRRAD
jgi:hypothetical protein